MEHGNFLLPKGLVGEKCMSETYIAGKKCASILDTGSQVTTIPQSFYEHNLSHLTIHPLSDLLEVKAANGQCVPYLGYIEVEVTFPESFFGAQIELSTLALVVPDTCSGSQSVILIGTNTLDHAYEELSKVQPNNPNKSLPYGLKSVLNVLAGRAKQKDNSRIGLVHLPRTGPKTIPAGQSCVLEASTRVFSRANDKWVLMEPSSTSVLPGGLLVTSCLLALPENPYSKLPVVLKNETDHDILLPSNVVVAELHSLRQVFQTNPAAIKTPNESVSCYGLNLDFGDSPLPTEWKDRISQKLNDMQEVFSQYSLDFGRTDKVTHHIKLSDETPFTHRARPIHPQDLEAVRKHLQELLEAGIIRESESSFSSPIVVVKKKTGDVRLCIDYRKLNLQTIKDAYALPNLEETLSALAGSKWFSVLDLKSGYYQIEVAESDKHKTAFVCPLGFWEFNRMPQGITNAPSTFQRLMEKCMSDLHLKEVLVFLDDLIIFSDTLEEHESRLLRVLDRLKEYGLKLSQEKCKFFQTSVRYLGHIISQHGIETDPEKIQSLRTWPTPKTLKRVAYFLRVRRILSKIYPEFLKDCETFERFNSWLSTIEQEKFSQKESRLSQSKRAIWKSLVWRLPGSF
uniref:ribonuclease H n=1 Tax=Astyanax mexicanus TaxID=7994 RepID=A0A3B1IZ75_ASTMX